MADHDSITDRLRRAMNAKGLKNVDLAKACGVSDQAVGKWFLTGSISKKNLVLAAQACGVTVDELLTGQKSDHAPVEQPASGEPGVFLVVGDGVREEIDQEALDIALAWRGLSAAVKRTIGNFLLEETAAQHALIRDIFDRSTKEGGERANRILEEAQRRLRSVKPSETKPK